jgi:hypothetical protein
MRAQLRAAAGARQAGLAGGLKALERVLVRQRQTHSDPIAGIAAGGGQGVIRDRHRRPAVTDTTRPEPASAQHAVMSTPSMRRPMSTGADSVADQYANRAASVPSTPIANQLLLRASDPLSRSFLQHPQRGSNPCLRLERWIRPFRRMPSNAFPLVRVGALVLPISLRALSSVEWISKQIGTA